MKYNIHTLENGLRIVFAPMPDTETATVFVMTGTGSRYENEKENGLAHFLEHMFFKGTKKRPSAKKISEELDAVGSQYNAFTSKDRTAYYAKVASKYFDTALDVISDIFLNSTLPAKEIEKERGAIVQEIDMYEDMPMNTIDNVFEALLYGAEHPLGRTILGSKENIHSFKQDEFAAYHKRNYTSTNTIVAIAGNFSEKNALAKIKKEFGRLKSSPAPEYLASASNQREPRISIKEKKTDQTQVMIGVPAYPYLHKDEYALAVLSALLAGGMSSRLFLEVREKRGLAYSISAWNEKYPDTGHFVVQAGVEHAKLEETIKVILKELRKVAAKKVSTVELNKVKSQFEGGLALNLETSSQVAGGAASSMLSVGRVRTLEEALKAIQKVTPEDLQRVAKDLFKTEKLNLAIIGPHTNAEKFRSLLKV